MQLEAIQTLHDKDMIYRDIKADNFMFAKRVINDEVVVRLVLADFGLAIKIGATNRVAGIKAGIYSLVPVSVIKVGKSTKKTDLLLTINTVIATMYGTIFEHQSVKDREHFESQVREPVKWKIRRQLLLV